MKKLAIITVFFLSLFNSFAQDLAPAKEKYTTHNKGKFFVSWGGNRDSFTKSNVRFTGTNYDFTIFDTKAQDKPKGWHIDYINPGRMTIPQTNFRMGYFINDHYSIAIGLDHMKYVLTQDQTATISGHIDSPLPFAKIYDNTPTVITESFLKYEHTDGLNYINTEFSRHDDISSLFKIENTDKIQINLTEGVGVGLLYPKTNTTLLGKPRHDDFHVSGYGTSVKAGLNITVFKHFYVQGELKGGYINMPDIRTTQSPDDRASQHFFFFQRIIAFGGIFRI